MIRPPVRAPFPRAMCPRCGRRIACAPRAPALVAFLRPHLDDAGAPCPARGGVRHPAAR